LGNVEKAKFYQERYCRGRTENRTSRIRIISNDQYHRHQKAILADDTNFRAGFLIGKEVRQNSPDKILINETLYDWQAVYQII